MIQFAGVFGIVLSLEIAVIMGVVRWWESR